MKKIKILSVLGTRPEAIKLAPVIMELARRSAAGEVQSRLCVTAQHRGMLDQVLQVFGIVPDYDLDLMRENQSPLTIAADIFTRLAPILAEEQPDWLLVQGDTTTVMAAALVAAHLRIKAGHVEAGLRTHDKWQPFPEEINRRMAGVIADLHFAPTEQARQNLLAEGVPDTQIFVTGNPVIDALQWVARQPIRADSTLPELAALLTDPGVRLILVTAHRRENFGQSLENICAALRDLATMEHSTPVQIVYPVHPNPNIQKPVHRLLTDVPNLTLIPPLDYFAFVHLMQRAWLILTDSGGIQEEAPGLGKPVLVLREMTERSEAVAAGAAKVVGANRGRIVSEVKCLLDDAEAYRRMVHAPNPFGDGQAARRIVEILLTR